MGVLAARSLIVVRCCWIAVVRCMLSSLFSPVAFLRYPCASFEVRCTLIALYHTDFADNSLLFATPFLLINDGYWLFASRCSVSISRCLVVVSRYSPAWCSLRITYCTLLVISDSLLPVHWSLLSSRLESSADRCKSSRIVHCCSRFVICFSESNSHPSLMLITRSSLLTIHITAG